MSWLELDLLLEMVSNFIFHNCYDESSGVMQEQCFGHLFDLIMLINLGHDVCSEIGLQMELMFTTSLNYIDVIKCDF